MLNYFKQPKIRALISTILVVTGAILSIEAFGWLIVHYGIEMLAIAVVLIMAWLSRSIYASYVEKYTKQKEKDKK